MIAAADIVVLLANAGPAGTAPADADVLWRFLGRLHPLVVHFPVALIIVAAALESLMFLRKGRRVSRTAVTCLVIGATAAGLAAWLGWLNADHEPHTESVSFTLTLHRWIGVSTAACAVIATAFGLPARFGQAWAVHGYRWMLLIAACLVAAGGFLGGELVHGRGHLVAVFREPAPVPVPDTLRPLPPVDDAMAATPVSVAADIQPLLAERCGSCHGPDRQRGDLRLVPVTAALARTPPVIQPGRPDGSLLLTRVRLPADHPDRMPRKGDPLTDGEIASLARWIAQGAPHDQVVPPPPPVEPDTPAEPEPAPVEPEPAPVEPQPPADPTPEQVAAQAKARAVDAIRERGGVVTLPADDRADVEVSFRAAEPAAVDDDLALLRGLEPSLTRLDLSRSAVTDAGVETLAAFERLAWLNLSGTGITDAAIATLAALPGLEQVFIWKTGITASGAAHLRRLRPGLDVVTTAPALPAEPPEPEPVDEGPGEAPPVEEEDAAPAPDDGPTDDAVR